MRLGVGTLVSSFASMAGRSLRWSSCCEVGIIGWSERMREKDFGLESKNKQRDKVLVLDPVFLC